MEQPIDLSFLKADSLRVARELIGWRLYKQEDGQLIGGTIVETEAYTEMDAASHSYRGETPRTKVMFGPAGYIYVYFTYGMHYCMNIVTGSEGHGSAVLIRAIAPDKGLAIIRARRQHRPDPELTNGPAKVCQALGITLAANGMQLNHGTLLLLPPVNKNKLKILVTKRIGISKAQDRLWRFVLDN